MPVRRTWADLAEAEIRSALFAAPPFDHPTIDFGLRFPPELTLREAAVLVPFIQTPKGWEVLFTRRTELVQDHKGQVSFPGGGVEPGDPGPAGTALREAWEEIGLPPDDVRILGYIEPMMSRGGFRIIPVVGVIPWPFPVILSEEEVSRVFTIPLAWLADPSNHRERIYTDGEVVRNIPVIFFDEYDGELLWGISGRITVSLIERLEKAIT